MIEEEKRKILEYIHAGTNDAMIMQGLNIPRRMYQRRMQSIRQSHLREVLDSQTAEAKASAMKLCEDKLKWLEMRAQKIVMDPNARHSDQLEAMDRVRTFQIDQAKLIIEGPTIFRIIPTDGLHRGLKATADELRDAPAISEPAAGETITTTTNDERQF